MDVRDRDYVFHGTSVVSCFSHDGPRVEANPRLLVGERI